jgi:Protein of unknown function (DUF3344).
MKSEIHKEGVLGRLSGLLTGSAKPRRAQSLMVVLLLLGVLSLAGVVSADPYWKGELLTTNITGTGDVWFQQNDCFTTTPVYPNLYQENTTTFQIPAAAVGNISWARLYVVVYLGNMSATYTGTETVKWTNNGIPYTLTDSQPLDLAYDRTVGASYNTTAVSGKLLELNRVTSDYLTIFDVKDYLTTQSSTLYVKTTNVSGTWDGRIKEAVLVIGYNDGNTANDVKYFVNVGHDTVTKDWTSPAYVSNTTFATGTLPSAWTGTLSAIYLSSADGVYSYSAGAGSTSLPSNHPGNFGRPSYNYTGNDTWDVSGVGGNDLTLFYNRSGSYYKLPLAILKVNPITTIYDFSGNYVGQPGTNEWAYGNQITTNTPIGSTPLPSTSITTASGIKYLADGDVTQSQAGTYGRYAAQYLQYQVSESAGSITDLSLTLNVSGQNTNSSLNGFDVFVWNQRTATWDNKYSTTDSTYKYFTLDLAPASDYVDSSGYVKVLIIQKGTRLSGTPQKYSNIYNDYDRLTVIDP